MVAIGRFTDKQLSDVNAVRRGLDLNEISDPEIVYIGRHHYVSRSVDGYTVEDMWLQVRSALDASAVVKASPKMTTMQNPAERADGYGSQVRDLAVFELTQRKPRAELYSLIPKGDSLPLNANRLTKR